MNSTLTLHWIPSGIKTPATNQVNTNYHGPGMFLALQLTKLIQTIMKYNRRKFLTVSAIGGGASVLPAFATRSIGSGTGNDPAFSEPSRKIPVAGEYDVIVCGGGPAGIAAAISSARSGAKTLLLELGGCLGGVWTSGLLTFIFDFDKPGITKEIKQRLTKLGGKRNTNEDKFTYSPEYMKLLLEEMCTESGVDFILHTRVVAAYKEKSRLTTIATESKSGREAWRAKAFIDTTGDGDLGALAGNGWDIGHGGEVCPCQPLTLNALAVVDDVTKFKKFMSMYDPLITDLRDVHVPSALAFKEEIRKVGLNPSYGHPTIFPIRDNLVMLMLNHEYDVKAFDARAVSKATVNARAEIHEIAKRLAASGQPWDKLQVVASADHIGIRDGRRLHGRHTMTKLDLVNGARYDDAVARVTFGVDIHAPNQETNDKEPISKGGIKMSPYEIPIRALIAKDVDGLMMAGRCISGDFIAHSSYRVTGNAVAMGEAAGVVSAIAAGSKRVAHQVSWKEAKEVLDKIRS